MIIKKSIKIVNVNSFKVFQKPLITDHLTKGLIDMDINNTQIGCSSFTATTLLRLILDYADSVEEAVEIASAYDLHDSANTSYHYMVALYIVQFTI